MTFSVAGAVLSLAILAPNLTLLIWPPRHPSPNQPSPHWALTGLERAGQVFCLVLPALTATRSGINGWFVVTVIAVIVYYLLWVRYVTDGRNFNTLYRPLGPLPVPMAVFPVLAFGAGAGWLQSWPLALGTVILALGHISNSWRLWRTIRWRDNGRVIRKHVIVHGSVQGVGFRYWTRAEAARLGVTGWVRNRPDGTVEAEIEGEQAAVTALETWLSRGPSEASVTGIDSTEIEVQGEGEFVIRQG